MKISTLLFFSVFVIHAGKITAQDRLFGVTEDGGNSDNGTIYSIDVPSNRFVCHFKFTGPNGANPVGSMIQASDQKFYGLTHDGGLHNAGVLFSFDPVGNTTSIKFNFGSTYGKYPTGGLLLAPDGKLYGTTEEGGSSNSGVLFSYDPTTDVLQKLYDFSTPGPAMTGRLIAASDGKLYGLHSSRHGIFSFDPIFNNYELLRQFTLAEGRTPRGTLLQASDGRLYGTARAGGDNGYGTLFSFDPSNGDLVVHRSFSLGDGAYPVGDLIQDNLTSEDIKGLTESGGAFSGGTIFKFDPLTSTFTKYHDFSSDDGQHPGGGLLFTPNAYLSYFGTTKWGGANGKGTIFRLGWSGEFEKIYDFTGANGSAPAGSLREMKVYHWNGYFSPNWGDPNNWGTEVPPPGASISVTPWADPLYLDQDRTVGNILWEEESDIHLMGKTLTVNGSLIGPGNFLGDPHTYLPESYWPGTFGSGLVFTGQADTLYMYNYDPGYVYPYIFNARGLHKLTLTSGASLILGSSLDIHNAIELTNATLDLNNQRLTLKSTDTTVARIGNLTGSTLSNATNVTVERYIPNTGRRWRLLTAPVDNITVNDAWQNGRKWNGVTLLNGIDSGTLITGQQQGSASVANSRGFDFWSNIANSSASVMSYTQRSGQGVWSPLPNTITPNAFNNDQAYLLFVRGPRNSIYSTGTANAATTLRPTGKIRQGNRNIWIDGTKGYTLIGNPYPSQIDFNSLYLNNGNSTVIKRQVWLWDATNGSTGNFQAVVYSGGKYVEVPAKFVESGQATPLTTIQTGQGFFVMPLTTSGGTLSIREWNKTTAQPAKPNILLSDETIPRVRLNLMRSGPDSGSLLADGIMVTYGNAYRMQSTDEEDVVKLENLAENMSVINGDTSLIADARPVSEMHRPIILRVSDLSQQSYRFEARMEGMKDMGLEAFLEDAQLRTRTPLAMDGTITSVGFRVDADPASQAGNRFRIVFERFAANAVPLSEATGGKGALGIYPNPVTGRSFTVKFNDLPAGTYTLQLFGNDGRMVMSREVRHEKGSARYSMEWNNALPAGTYQLRCLRGNESVGNEKLLVQ